jgi:peroxiredoxin
MLQESEMMKSLFTAAAILLSAPAMATAVVGQPAPAFTATDSQGRTQSLASLKGKPVVIEWTNPDCPFVQKFYAGGDMQKLQAEARKQGAVWLTVNSGAPGKQGSMTAAEANAKMKAQGSSPNAYIPDPSGEIGRAFGARTTPHMFVIDQKGTVVFAGGIDDQPTADPADIGKARNHVTAALADLAAGKPVEVASSRPYGCSIKY